MNPSVIITEFSPEYQPGIDLLLTEIQSEYPGTIYGSGTKKIAEVYDLPGRKYWVALNGDRLIGSIGIVLLANNNACIKSMFLQKEYRSGVAKIADKLLKTAIDFAFRYKAAQIFLGTMIQFKAAQAFYLKHGFKQVQEDELPVDFVKNPVDKVFFRLV